MDVMTAALMEEALVLSGFSDEFIISLMVTCLESGIELP